MRLVLLPAVFGLAVLTAVLVAPRVAPAPISTLAAGGVDATEAEAADGTSSVRTTVAVEPYAVTGGTPEAILSSLRQSGPQVDGGLFFGLTTTEVQYRFGYVRTAGACETADARVDMRVVIALPEWRPTADAPYDLRRDWNRFAAALRRHEEGHRDRAVAYAHRLQRSMVGLRAPTCDGAATLAARQAQRLQTEAEAEHRQYDQTTNHGETEGAVWPG